MREREREREREPARSSFVINFARSFSAKSEEQGSKVHRLRGAKNEIVSGN